MTIPRPRNHLHEHGHRKALYCPYCKIVINNFECYDDGDTFDFKERFLNGEFQDEAIESINYIQEHGVDDNE